MILMMLCLCCPIFFVWVFVLNPPIFVGQASINKEEDEKMRTTAANAAARVAVGGDDHLSKWQLMAEQARQKRQAGGGSEMGTASGREASTNNQSSSSFSASGLIYIYIYLLLCLSICMHFDLIMYMHTGGGGGSVKRTNQSRVQQRSIGVRDVIAVLERESRPTLLYNLYNRTRNP